MLFFLFINVKMPTIVGILTFMSMKNSMLNSLEHEKSFITSGTGACVWVSFFGLNINYSKSTFRQIILYVAIYLLLMMKPFHV